MTHYSYVWIIGASTKLQCVIFIPYPKFQHSLNDSNFGVSSPKSIFGGAYNLVRIKLGDNWKTTFRTYYGLFEYKVMAFGLTNVPSVFQHMMNNIFRKYLDHFVVIYLDDIPVFSSNIEEHTQHVRLVLSKVREHGLYAKSEKCEFDPTCVEFLGYVI